MKSTELYSKKQKWKIVLSIVALLIVGVSLWYTNYITQKIQKDERQRVQLWSETVKKQAQLVNLTNETFEQLRVEEQKKMEIWTEAMRETGRDQLDYSFITSVLSKNTSIPIIQESTSIKNNIIDTVYSERNLTFGEGDFATKALFYDTLKTLKKKWAEINTPIYVKFKYNQSTTFYYDNSKLFNELKQKSDSIISSFTNELIKNSALLPIVFIDSSTREIIASNVEEKKLKDSASIEKVISQMESENSKISVSLGDGVKGEIYYFESNTLKQLRYYPWVQITIIGLFLVIAYFLFSTFRKAEQNQVWAGMAKETAHQLGTPLSSLMAWIELLRAQGVDEESLNEMNKDIKRLDTITDRFSKIGSQVKTEEKNIAEMVSKSIAYLDKRVSRKVKLIQQGDKAAKGLINESLFEWVIENLTKNAVDAIQGEGSITYVVFQGDNEVIIDITDTGKGVPINKQKSIFNPGYTTKERGWGLGLSLVKRIVEEQLKGKIYVKSSEVNVGTTFRIIIPGA